MLIFQSEKWFNYVITFFFFNMSKIWVGRTTLDGERLKRPDVNAVSIKHRLRTEDHGLLTGYKTRTKYKI